MQFIKQLSLIGSFLFCLSVSVFAQQTRQTQTAAECVPQPNQSNCKISMVIYGRRITCEDKNCDCICDSRTVTRNGQYMDIAKAVQVRVGGVDPCIEESVCRYLQLHAPELLVSPEKIISNPIPQKPKGRYNNYSRKNNNLKKPVSPKKTLDRNVQRRIRQPR